MTKLPSYYQITPEVSKAIQSGTAVVALESTVITHGLPYPDNLELARDMEAQVRKEEAVPATISMIEGRINVGTSENELNKLAQDDEARKISVRDFGPAIAQKANGGTTVAGTLIAAHQAGIQVFATGGIGGVHRNAPFDISTDLGQLALSPVIVVCAGAKAILDLPATLEKLETLGVPVIGYQTDDFPAFYSRRSGLPVSAKANNPDEVAEIAKAHWGMGFTSAILLVVPPPADVALDNEQIERIIEQALMEAEANDVHGQAVTPFLLKRVSELSKGDSLKANLGLLKNNAKVAAQVACALSLGKTKLA